MGSVGWIGMGNIGAPMAMQMIKAGHDVYVWARNQDRLRPALAQGAHLAASPADMTRKCDAVFLCVTDAKAVEQVVFADDGVAAGGAPGKVLVDHSTIHPERSREMARRLRDASGMGWLDAPVSGGKVGAEERTLVALVGGESADLEKTRAYMSAYCSKITRVGDSGAGQIAKSCNQAVLATTIAVWAEALNYAYRAGADMSLLVDALEGSWSDSPVRRLHAPYMVTGDYPTGQASMMLKDLDIVADVARATNSPMPVSSSVVALLRQQLAMGLDKTGPWGVMQIYHKGPMHPIK